MRFTLLLLLLVSASVRADCVILLHGLARTEVSMEPMAEFLEAEGFTVTNPGYPSRHASIEELAEATVPAALDACQGSEAVHFVTHSMGGILVRQYLAGNDIARLGRVVMLGPPNRGSEVVDTLGELPGFQLLNGEAGLQLGTGGHWLPDRLGPANFDVGVIAGTKSLNPLLSAMIPGDDDGKVSVHNAALEGMRDFIALPATHTFMMRDAEVMCQVLHYLQHGSFLHAVPPGKSCRQLVD